MSFQTAAWPSPSCALWCSSTLYYHYYFSCCCCFFLLLLFFLLLPILLSTSLIKGPGLLRGPSLSWPCMILTPVLSFAVMLNCLFSYYLYSESGSFWSLSNKFYGRCTERRCTPWQEEGVLICKKEQCYVKASDDIIISSTTTANADLKGRR